MEFSKVGWMELQMVELLVEMLDTEAVALMVKVMAVLKVGL
jgi:hypothetical protein